MPKRKSAPGELAVAPTPSLASFDAALDMLACETFSHLQSLAVKFESAAGVKLNDGVVKHRWEEAANRYWLMKSLDDLSCNSAAKQTINGYGTDSPGEVSMVDGDEVANGRDRDGSYERPMPSSHHPGAVMAFGLDSDEEQQWRRWSPRINDVVLIQLAKGDIWPGKIIDKRIFFQGRTMPRGNHFFPVRIYNDELEPTVTVKARLLPFNLRPTPPLMASTALISAYNHAANPTSFDMHASNREVAAAHARTHPGVGDDEGMSRIKAEKEQWKKFVNWLMDERRVEKLRALCEERERRLKAVTRSSATDYEGSGSLEDATDPNPRKRRVTMSVGPFTYKDSKTIEKMDGDANDRGGIFRITSLNSSPSTTAVPSAASSRAGTPMASYIRPALSASYRSSSPRRTDRRRNGSLFTGLGEFSPRARGGTYTPPRVLPSGDETAPYNSPSPAPSLKSFDFVSPLGPVKFAKPIDDDVQMVPRTGGTGTSLEAVQEEKEEEGWTVVRSRSRAKRAGSAPCETATEAAPRMGGSSDDSVL